MKNSDVACLISENGKFYFVKYGLETIKVEVSPMDLEDLAEDAAQLLNDYYDNN